jgi:CheY-like chemotaxis protein
MILVVEDSAGLRQVLCRQLSTAGYRVLEAADGRTALDMIETIEAIDMMLTDIVMPGGMNGHQLTRAAVNLRPHLKTLLTTGFAGLTNGAGAAASNAHILRKPYRKEELLRLVHETLNG